MSGPIRVPPVEQFLILCARPELTGPQIECLQNLVAQGIDWNQVIGAAHKNQIVNLTRRHLNLHITGGLPDGIGQRLHVLSIESVKRQMEIIRVQRMIAVDYLLPRRINHVFIKGAMLSAQYYADPFLRQCRDIDVLMHLNDITTVGAELVAAGYQITNKAWQSMRSPDLSALAQYSAALELRSPSGVGVELHQRLDNSGCVFAQHILSEGRPDASGLGFEGRVLPFASNYVYLLFHHSRHRWSSLHWTADLAALSPRIDSSVEAIDEFSGKCGLSATVRQAQLLRNNLEALALTGELKAGEDSSLFLADCLAGLASTIEQKKVSGGDDAEDDHREPDFPYPWQKTRTYRLKFQMHRVHPTLDDFNACPLPAPWRSLYYATKPFRVVFGLRGISN